MNRIIKTGGLVAVAAVALSACAYSGSSEVGLQYANGIGESRTFVECLPANSQIGVGPSDRVYYYPTGTRDFNFNRDEGRDSDPLTTTTKGTDPNTPGIELTVLGQVKFSVTADCDKLRAFHETIGAAKHVPSEESGVLGEGWRDFILNNVKVATDRSIDNESPAYTPAELYNQPDKRAAWEKAVGENLKDELKGLVGEGVVTVDKVTLQKPDLPDAVKNGITAQEEARVRQQAAETDLKTAGMFGGIDKYTEYLSNLAAIKVQEATARGIDAGRLSPAVVPAGTSIMIPK